MAWFEVIRQFLENLQAGIYPDLGGWTYVLLGVLVATEGPLSTLIGASAAAAGLLAWEWVLLATILGNVVGDCVWYSVGYLGRMQWLYDHGRWFGMRPHHVARLEREMRTHARKLIIFAKVAYGLIVPTLVAAGMARVPWRKWFPVVFVVETIWSILLVVVGYHATAFIQEFEKTIHSIGMAAIIAIVAFVVMRFLRRRIDQTELALDPLTTQEHDAVLPPAGVTALEPKTAEARQNGTAHEYAAGDRRESEIHRCEALPEREHVR